MEEIKKDINIVTFKNGYFMSKWESQKIFGILYGFEKVLGRNFCCLDCKHHWSNLPYLDSSACINEETCEELQLTDQIIAEIKKNMNDADEEGKNIHPRYELFITKTFNDCGGEIEKGLELIL